jgi:hypothetical protein
MTDLTKMWGALANHQPLADTYSYGPAWARMCAEKTKEAAYAAAAYAATASAVSAATAHAHAHAHAAADVASYVAQVIECVSKANDASTHIKHCIKE